MSATTPTTEPTQITVGSTVAWTKTLDDYSAADGWTLNYRLRSKVAGGFGVTITSTASGGDHAVNLSASTTGTYVAGEYTWFSYVTNADSTIRWDVDRGTIEILPDPALSTSYDGRTHARKMLDAIEATLEGRASASELEAEIDGRRVQYLSHTELIKARDKYRAEVRAEEKKEAAAKGKGTGSRILTRFNRPT